jgi:hypothetical protein
MTLSAKIQTKYENIIEQASQSKTIDPKIRFYLVRGTLINNNNAPETQINVDKKGNKSYTINIKPIWEYCNTGKLIAILDSKTTKLIGFAYYDNIERVIELNSHIVILNYYSTDL